MSPESRSDWLLQPEDAVRIAYVCNTIQLVLVDVPMPQAIPCIHYFLYALNAEGGIDRAFTVRGLLFDIAARRGSAEDIRNAFEKARIVVEPFELTGVFVAFNELLREDAIRSTPTAVIHRDGGSESHAGRVAILEALRQVVFTKPRVAGGSKCLGASGFARDNARQEYGAPRGGVRYIQRRWALVILSIYNMISISLIRRAGG